MHTGVLVGSDRSQEWLLAWFYTHFRQYNPHCPIAFADFGLSKEGCLWCQERGPIIVIPEIEKKEFFFQGDYWQEWKASLIPNPCLKKPLALSLSPFERTLWLDLDCQVRGDLSILLSLQLSSNKLAASPCHSYIHVKNLSTGLVFLIDKYNTGVILTEKDSPLLNQWTSSIDTQSFRTDEGSLSFLAEKSQLEVTQISHRYNWPLHVWGENPDALIYHWLGKEAKNHLKNMLFLEIT